MKNRPSPKINIALGEKVESLRSYQAERTKTRLTSMLLAERREEAFRLIEAAFGELASELFHEATAQSKELQQPLKTSRAQAVQTRMQFDEKENQK